MADVHNALPGVQYRGVLIINHVARQSVGMGRVGNKKDEQKETKTAMQTINF